MEKIHTAGRNIVCPEGMHDRGCQIIELVGNRTFDSLVVRPEGILTCNEIAEVDSALGVLTFCDTKTALKIGKFDENYPLWIEDDDFYLSYRLYNKKVFYLPDVMIIHRTSLRGPRNPRDLNSEKVYKKTKKFIKKNIPFINSFYHLIKRNRNFKDHRERNDWRSNILRHDYNYWKTKWGFDPINPDINYILERYKGTEINWKYNVNLKKEGEKIIQKFKNNY